MPEPLRQSHDATPGAQRRMNRTGDQMTQLQITSAGVWQRRLHEQRAGDVRFHLFVGGLQQAARQIMENIPRQKQDDLKFQTRRSGDQLHAVEFSDGSWLLVVEPQAVNAPCRAQMAGQRQCAKLSSWTRRLERRGRRAGRARAAGGDRRRGSRGGKNRNRPDRQQGAAGQ